MVKKINAFINEKEILNNLIELINDVDELYSNDEDKLVWVLCQTEFILGDKFKLYEPLLIAVINLSIAIRNDQISI